MTDRDPHMDWVRAALWTTDEAPLTPRDKGLHEVWRLQSLIEEMEHILTARMSEETFDKAFSLTERMRSELKTLSERLDEYRAAWLTAEKFKSEVER